MNNLFCAGMPTPEEAVSILYQSEQVRIERIVSWHHTSPEGFWYDQEEDEWLVLLEGDATLTYDAPDAQIAPVCPLKKGEPLLIPAHQRHRVSHTSAPAIWLCVFVKIC